MTVRPFNFLTDFSILCEFWKRRGVEYFAKELLPETGLVVEVDDEIICMGFIYFTNSDSAILCWPVANPDAERKSRDEGIDLLLKSLQELGREEGYKMNIAFTDHPSLKKRLEKSDFLIGDKDTTLYLKANDGVEVNNLEEFTLNA